MTHEDIIYKIKQEMTKMTKLFYRIQCFSYYKKNQNASNIKSRKENVSVFLHSEHF